ncbi:MAG: hypothetical protein ACRCXT_16560 [Paraclostridium sp.]
MSKFVVYIKHNDYRICSNDIIFNDNGVWICDDLETKTKDFETFIPYSNIKQVIKYSDEVFSREQQK